MLRESIGAHLAGQDAARLQEGERGVGVPERIVGEPREHEIGDARIDRDTETLQLARKPGPPDIVVLSGAVGRGELDPAVVAALAALVRSTAQDMAQ